MVDNEITLIIVSLERDSLIRDEVRAQGQRERLERAVRDAVIKLGHSVDEVSEASGLTPAEIRTLIELPPTLTDELAELCGMC